MPTVNGTTLARYFGVGPGTASEDVAITIPEGYGIVAVALRSRAGTNGFGAGVYSSIHTQGGAELLCQSPTGRTAGPNGFGGVQDPGLSAVLATYSVTDPAEPRTDITGFRLTLSTPDGSGWQGFGEAIQAEYTLAELPAEDLGLLL